MNDYTLTDFLTDTTNNHWTGRVTPEKITELAPSEVMVFGSNAKGIHGKGAAKDALKFGAQMGKGFGLAGQTFAIPTKSSPYQKMFLFEVKTYVQFFISFAEHNHSLTFLVTPIATGYAGYTAEEIAPFFANAVNIPNIHLPKSFWDILLK